MVKDIFNKAVADEVINRINQLTPELHPNWGKMSVDQMVAHCNIPYQYTFEPEKFQKPNFFKKFFLKSFVKNLVVSEKPYKPNGPTAPEFIIKGSKDFEKEKNLLIANIQKSQELGRTYFEGKENHSFGKLSAQEWNNMFYKHIDHHLRQFGIA